MIRNRNREHGFTLIEIMIAMALSLLLMSGIYYTYFAQQKVYQVQDQMVAMQQNLRTAMHYIERDLRGAGFDDKAKNRSSSQEAGMETAEADRIVFSLYGNNQCQPDRDGSPKVIVYEIYDSAAAGNNTLGRRCGDDENTAIEPIAPGIEVIDFVYLGTDDDGNMVDLDTDGDGDVQVDRFDEIRWIQVTLVARTERPDREYTDSKAYTNPQEEEILPAQDDHYRRKVISTRVNVRNLNIRYPG